MNQETQISTPLDKIDIINSLKETLEATTTKIEELKISWSEFRQEYPLCPPIDKYDLTIIADNTLKKLAQLVDIRLDEYHLNVLSSYTKQVQKIETSKLFKNPSGAVHALRSIPHVGSGNQTYSPLTQQKSGINKEYF